MSQSSQNEVENQVIVQNTVIEVQIETSNNPAPNTTIFGIDLNLINKPNYEDPQVLNHKTNFDKWLNENYLKTNTSFVMKWIEITQVKDVMMGVKKIDHENKRFQFKKKILLD